MFRLLWIGLAAPALALAVSDTETIRQSFPAPPRLEIRNFNGDIRVTASAGNSIQLTATKRIEADTPAALSRAKAEVRLDVQQEAGRLRVCVEQVFIGCEETDRSSFRWSHRHDDYEAAVDLELQVPANIELELRTVNGAVSATGTRGGFRLKSVNGAVRVIDVDGAGEAATVNGTVQVNLRSMAQEGVRAKTVNGSIELALPKGPGANLAISTFRGDVFTNIPESALIHQSGAAFGKRKLGGNRKLTFRLNGGGPAVELQTVNGNIQIAER